MRKGVMIVLLGLFVLQSCAVAQKKPKAATTPLDPLPEYSDQVPSVSYYQLWVEAEADLELCVKRCDGVR